MRVCVLGCGAIGALYAAHLARLPELEVWGYDVSAPHVEAINANGLTLTGAADFVARIQATTDAAEIPPCALGIIATKGRFTEAAIAASAAAFADGAVCSVQNGIGNEEILARYVPRVIRGVALPAGHIVAPGVVNFDAPGTTWIGPFEPKPARGEEITALAELLNRGGMETVALPDARGAQWTKLLFNCSTNPLCALTGLTHGELCDHPPTRAVVGQLIDEGRRVADALGITLDSDPAAMVDAAARDNHHHKPSMLQDALARRPTEIATLNGGVVAAGAAVRVPTPLNALVAGLVSGLEHSWG